MGVHQNKEVYTEIKKLLDIPVDEPIFIIRAQDKFSFSIIKNYKNTVIGNIPIGNKKWNEWKEQVESIMDNFINWQRANRDKVKVPD